MCGVVKHALFGDPNKKPPAPAPIAPPAVAAPVVAPSPVPPPPPPMAAVADAAPITAASQPSTQTILPAAQAAPSLEVGGSALDAAAAKAKGILSKGKKALRIDRTAPMPSTGGALNIPTGG